MEPINYTWVSEQLASAKVRKMVGNSVIKLLKSWEEMEVEDKFAEETLEAFKHLALGHSLVAPYKDEVWVPVIPGQIKVADKIRVKHDAFKGKAGAVHNGRRGVVVAVRYGDIIIRSNDNKEPFLDGAHYSPFQLEKRIK